MWQASGLNDKDFMNNELTPDVVLGTRVVFSHPTFAFVPAYVQNGRKHLQKDAVYTVLAVHGEDDSAAIELEEVVGAHFAITQFDEYNDE
ncbi:hypothetical protein [Pseudoalteromonas umbrosa]|uniref:hypothetical protein n=1 Tax=Pseudoalteromonas umbrosa TaxID=3048489 RepID=UPI0024C354E1|nr:hypothetical protein [Pseudoalteromonas sp. B95]MDK1290091.1 hypothetical protein [Pseudoalteromonas sp. B95]